MRPGDTDTIMVGHAYGPAVVRALSELPGRKLPRAALRVYMMLLCELEPGTGVLQCSLQQLAQLAHVGLSELEVVMPKLAELRIVVHDPRRSDDAWCINPHLAWLGSLPARARFAELVPPPAVEPDRGG